MSKPNDRELYDYDFLLNKIQTLEKRLTSIESMMRIEWIHKKEQSELEINEEYSVEKTESTIVEYGLAWLGSIVFILGIVFLLSYLDNLGLFISSKIISYICAFSLIAFSYYYRESFPILGKVVNYCAPLLLFYITVRLHFFTEQPLIAQKGIGLLLLLMLIGLQVYFAYRKNSESLAVIAVTLAISAAIICNSTLITFFILTITALTALILFYQKSWWRLLIYSLFMVYSTHVLWLFNNPIMGNPMKIVESPQFSIVFLLGYGIIYSLSIFIPKEKLESNGALISTAIWNAMSFSLILLMTIGAFYKDNYVLISSSIACFCLIYSVILKIKSNRNFAPATYACFGFMALSTAIYGYFGLPNAYFLLVLQSFLVVSMALWFRSKIIVIANSFLFASILLLYIITSDHLNSINFAFAFTALATARILNWRKERLTLHTEIFRNINLLIAFFMVLFSLSHLVPSQYVTLSWTAAAITYLVLSIFLHNIKYRYMAILTMVVTGGHLFFIDLSQMEIGYRVIAFLVFAVIAIGVSLYYTKRMHSNQKQ